MTDAKPAKPVVHSWTSLVEYENCPRRWYHTKLIKSVTEGQSEQMREGNERHKALELGVRDGIPLPAKYEGDKGIVDTVRGMPGLKIVEWSFGLNRDWKETRFFADDVWIRGKIDVGIVGTKTAALIDYKTGSRKSVDGQLALFSLPAFVRWPYLQTVRTSYLWLGDKKMDSATYGAEDVPALKAEFAHRVISIESAVKRDNFPPIPSGLCAWCPVGRQRCEYWRAYKGLPK